MKVGDGSRGLVGLGLEGRCKYARSVDVEGEDVAFNQAARDWRGLVRSK